MAIEFKKDTVAGRVPAIWRGECKMLPAGFALNTPVAIGKVVLRGTPVKVNVMNHTCDICKTASVLNGGTTTAPRVNKGSLFEVGDKITKVGGAVATISKIDTSNADYDVLTLSTAISGLASGDVLAETDATAGEAKFEPNAVVGYDFESKANSVQILDCAYEAVVLEPSLDSPILPAWKNGFTMKANPNILFIAQ